MSIDDQTESKAWTHTLLLADRHKLTVYAAAYLELALRRKLPLATLDKELRTAAELEGVQLLGIQASGENHICKHSLSRTLF